MAVFLSMTINLVVDCCDIKVWQCLLINVDMSWLVITTCNSHIELGAVICTSVGSQFVVLLLSAMNQGHTIKSWNSHAELSREKLYVYLYFQIFHTTEMAWIIDILHHGRNRICLSCTIDMMAIHDLVTQVLTYFSQNIELQWQEY